MFERDGNIEEIAARREVILSAGAFNTPHILQLSGIGPEQELRRHGIPVVTHSPGVGKNLIEHPRIAVEFARRDPSAVCRMLRADRLALSLARSWLTGSGPASEPLAAAHLFLGDPGALGQPQLQFLFRLFNPRLDVRLPWQELTEPDCFGIVACLLHPKSRGSVSLASADPAQAPRIRMNLLADESDVEMLTQALDISRTIGRQRPLAEMLVGEFGP
ncbi:GMC family oxidoreductase N-terminal domain-containing protein, partial [Rhizobiaceae sp. 2RAB30]